MLTIVHAELKNSLQCLVPQHLLLLLDQVLQSLEVFRSVLLVGVRICRILQLRFLVAVDLYALISLHLEFILFFILLLNIWRLAHLLTRRYKGLKALARLLFLIRLVRCTLEHEGNNVRPELHFDETDYTDVSRLIEFDNLIRMRERKDLEAIIRRDG